MLQDTVLVLSLVSIVVPVYRLEETVQEHSKGNPIRASAVERQNLETLLRQISQEVQFLSPYEACGSTCTLRAQVQMATMLGLLGLANVGLHVVT